MECRKDVTAVAAVSLELSKLGFVTLLFSGTYVVCWHNQDALQTPQNLNIFNNEHLLLSCEAGNSDLSQAYISPWSAQAG